MMAMWRVSKIIGSTMKRKCSGERPACEGNEKVMADRGRGFVTGTGLKTGEKGFQPLLAILRFFRE